MLTNSLTMAEDKKAPQNIVPKHNQIILPKGNQTSGQFKGSEGRAEKSFSPRPPLPPKK